MGFVFTVKSPGNINEMAFFKNRNYQTAIRRLALAKAESVDVDSNCLVLGGDTIVCTQKNVLGKPESREHAREMLLLLSGTVHEVYSGIALVCRECGFADTGVSRTRVKFRTIDTGEIDEYLDLGEYADKAGAYAIQGIAMRFVESISGCYYNVVGLPVSETIRIFESYINRKGAGYDRCGPYRRQ
jgi:septum formation protein